MTLHETMKTKIERGLPTRLRRLLWTGASCLLLTSGVARADSDAAPPHRHHRPPAEAFAACASLAEGASCTVTFHEHTHDGTCKQAPSDSEDAGKLVCVPPHPPGGHHPDQPDQPPPQQ